MVQFSTTQRRTFFLLQCCRSVIVAALTALIAQVVDFGTSLPLLMMAIVAGTLCSGLALHRNWRFFRVAGVHIVLFLVASLGLWLTNLGVIQSGGDSPQNDFLVYRFSEHLYLLGLFYLIGFLSTWFFWCLRQAATIEATLFGTTAVWLLSGHRNYQTDAPQQMSDWAWKLNLEPQHLLLGVGVVSTMFLATYLIVATDRPLFTAKNALTMKGPSHKLWLSLMPLLLVLLFFAYANYVNSGYSQQLSKGSSGVGTENREGKSPLGFHSAVGKTKQPAALVRLEGDYEKNPWAPMLYLREGALSEFNGRELVNANRAFDSDVPRIQPGQPFIALQAEPGPARTEVTQTIYLLTDHTSPFAIDFPKTIRLVENPDDTRFKLSYQAVSLAPVVRLDEVIGEALGEPTWDKATWNHYLRAPGSLAKNSELGSEIDFSTEQLDSQGEDLRYRALSHKLTETEETPVAKASVISQYLSQESIYTRNPGHQATKGGDPVAPYLFSEEKKGYCVHFSHAAVFMMRLAGIPARIGTGYLTDLTYAKDGHILLHLGDRHAWPEIYVQGIGWAVVDVTPARAENEQVIIPDEKLLEDLMSKIDPAHELVTPLPPEFSEPKSDLGFIKVLNKRNIGLTALIFSISFLGGKFWLRHGWRVLPAGRRKMRLAYVSHASLLTDLGLGRRFGETRWEFCKRAQAQWGIDASSITTLNEFSTYAQAHSERNQVAQALGSFTASFDKQRSRWRRILAFFSPLSLMRTGKW